MGCNPHGRRVFRTGLWTTEDPDGIELVTIDGGARVKKGTFPAPGLKWVRCT